MHSLFRVRGAPLRRPSKVSVLPSVRFSSSVINLFQTVLQLGGFRLPGACSSRGLEFFLHMSFHFHLNYIPKKSLPSVRKRVVERARGVSSGYHAVWNLSPATLLHRGNPATIYWLISYGGHLKERSRPASGWFCWRFVVFFCFSLSLFFT